MLIKEVDPIDKPAINLLEQDPAVDIIDEIVELPLRKACKILRQKGIETVMSSANKNNILKPGETAIEKEDIRRSNQNPFETRMFYDAGKGYAWIMINFDTLSDANKDLLFELEGKGENLGRAIWFVHPSKMDGNIEFSLKIGKYDYDDLRQLLSEDEIPKGIEVDNRLIEFEKRHVVLVYPWIDSTEAVFLRMPMNEQTTVEEVEKYFVKLANGFMNQTIDKKVDEAIKKS